MSIRALECAGVGSLLPCTGGDPDNLVAIEVKLSSNARPTEELLSTAAEGERIQQHRDWYVGLLWRMKQPANAEVHGTARLLEKIIGPDATYLERLTRIGITIDPQGRLLLTRLTDDIIEAGQQIKSLENGPVRINKLALKSNETDVARLLAQTPPGNRASR